MTDVRANEPRMRSELPGLLTIRILYHHRAKQGFTATVQPSSICRSGGRHSLASSFSRAGKERIPGDGGAALDLPQRWATFLSFELLKSAKGCGAHFQATVA